MFVGHESLLSVNASGSRLALLGGRRPVALRLRELTAGAKRLDEFEEGRRPDFHAVHPHKIIFKEPLYHDIARFLVFVVCFPPELGCRHGRFLAHVIEHPGDLLRWAAGVESEAVPGESRHAESQAPERGRAQIEGECLDFPRLVGLPGLIRAA